MSYLVIAVGIIIAMLAAGNAIQYKRNESLAAELAVEEARIQRFIEAEEDTRAKLELQKTAIKELLDSARQAQEASNAILKNSLQKAAEIEKKERDLMAKIRTGDICKDVSGALRSPLN